MLELGSLHIALGDLLLRLTSLLASLGLATACTSPIPMEALPREAALASCALVFDCCAEGERHGYADESTCVTEREMSGAITPQLQASLDAGRVRYDGGAAADCLAVAACDITAAAEICQNVYVPQVPPGEPCTGPIDCIDGFCLDGVCAGIARLGEACTNACELGAHCDPTDRVCVRSPAAGEPCPDFYCAEGAFCDFTAMMCEAARPAGEPCDNGSQCQSFSCAGTGVCAERRVGSVCS